MTNDELKRVMYAALDEYAPTYDAREFYKADLDRIFALAAHNAGATTDAQPPQAALSEAARNSVMDKLRRATDLLDSALGDSDPMIDPSMTQYEIEHEFPVMTAMQIIGDALAEIDRIDREGGGA